MSIALVGMGFALIVLTVWDAVSTMVSVEGGGPLTSRLAHVLWRATGLVPKRFRKTVRTRMGEVIALGVLGLWIALLWGAWTLVFLAAPGAVVDGNSGDPGGLVDRIYFAGFSLFTLGVGDFRPGPGFWQIATALASLNGLFLITVAISYLVSLTGAVADRRGSAAVLSGLGGSPQEIVLRAWNGQRFAGLSEQFANLAESLAHLAERHLAKPVLHYFHSPNRHTALEPSVVALYEALLVLSHGVAPQARPDEPALRSVRAACERILEVYAEVFIRRTARPLEPPSLAPLAEAGIPVVLEEEFAAALAREERRRGLAAAMLRESGWNWGDVLPD